MWRRRWRIFLTPVHCRCREVQKALSTVMMQRKLEVLSILSVSTTASASAAVQNGTASTAVVVAGVAVVALVAAVEARNVMAETTNNLVDGPMSVGAVVQLLQAAEPTNELAVELMPSDASTTMTTALNSKGVGREER